MRWKVSLLVKRVYRQMYGITQIILTAEIVQPNKASWSTLSASALRHPSRLKPAAANRTRPALDRSACCSCRSWPGSTCRSERRCVATCTYQRLLGGDWRTTETNASRDSSNNSSPWRRPCHFQRSSQKLADLRAIVMMSRMIILIAERRHHPHSRISESSRHPLRLVRLMRHA